MVTVLATSDVHGTALPLDYTRNVEVPDTGLVKISTLVKGQRALDPEALLVDVGDTLQGSPFVHLANVSPRLRHPFTALMNQVGYDAMVVGNHDFDYGIPLLERIEREARFPLLGANAIEEATGKPRFLPYMVRDIRGVRVGILGVTSPGIPGWLPPRNWQGLRFEQSLATVRRLVAHLRQAERCDLVVVAFHGGPQEPHADGEEGVNNGYEMVREVPGIDLLLTGHTHKIVNERLGSTMVLQGGSYGRGLAVARFHLLRDGDGGRFRVLRSNGIVQMVSPRIPADPAAVAVVAEHERRTQEYLDTPLATVDGAMTLEAAAWHDTALMDLIQAAQMDATGASVSLCSLFDPYARLEGPVTIRHMFKLYPFENFLYSVRMTGRDLRVFLENAAKAYRYEAGTDDGLVGLDPAFPLFNLDVLQGLEYRIDPRRPGGSRLVEFRDGDRPVADDAVYTVALNSYRAGGTGGYEVVRSAPVISRSDASVRDIVIDHLKRVKRVEVRCDDNWRLELGSLRPRFEALVKE